jgi:hypothetical protein
MTPEKVSIYSRVVGVPDGFTEDVKIRGDSDEIRKENESGANRTFGSENDKTHNTHKSGQHKATRKPLDMEIDHIVVGILRPPSAVVWIERN